MHPLAVLGIVLNAYTSRVRSSYIRPRETTNSFWATSMPATCFTIFFIPFDFNKSENLPSFCLLVGYSGYPALQDSLHSAQTRRDKKRVRQFPRENIL